MVAPRFDLLDQLSHGSAVRLREKHAAMRFDFGFELFGRLFRFALLRSGEQSVHGDFRLFGQVKSLLKRVCRISGNDIVGGEHNGSGTLTGCVSALELP